MVFQAVGIGKSFGPTVALNAVDLELNTGEVCALVGENGSGKSTLMRILHGEILPDEGSMTLNGEPYAPRSPRDAMNRGMALVHQELAVCGHMTVWENVFLGAEKGVSIPARVTRTRELLARLGHGSLDPNTIVHKLSPAIRQIVEIARALRSDAKVILFDEPTSSLGRQDVARLFDVVRELKQDRAIVYISHFLDEIAEIADRVVVLRDGRNAGVSPVRNMTVSVIGPKDTAEIIRLMTGREAEQVYHRTDRPAGETILTANPVNVSLELKKGEVFGIAGLNGAGRTEVVRCLFGLDPGLRTTPARRWREGFGFVSEDRKAEGLALNLTLAENLTMPNPRGASLHPGRDEGNGKKSITARTEAIIDRLRVKCQSSNQPISALSGGNQQKIAIGRLLDMKSEILLLDEPTRGIDIGSKAEIFRLIDELANQGKSIVLISSYLPELLGLCDRIAVMRRGEIVATLDAKKTDEHEVMQICTGA